MNMGVDNTNAGEGGEGFLGEGEGGEGFLGEGEGGEGFLGEGEGGEGGSEPSISAVEFHPGAGLFKFLGTGLTADMADYLNTNPPGGITYLVDGQISIALTAEDFSSDGWDYSDSGATPALTLLLEPGDNQLVGVSDLLMEGTNAADSISIVDLAYSSLGAPLSFNGEVSPIDDQNGEGGEGEGSLGEGESGEGFLGEGEGGEGILGEGEGGEGFLGEGEGGEGVLGEGEDGEGTLGEGDESSSESASELFRVDYNDADWNYLGSSYSDEFGNGYNINEVIDGIRYEKGAENRFKLDGDNKVVTNDDGEAIVSEQSSYEYRFDVETGEMLGGSQVNGPTTITYGANFEVISKVTEIDTDSADFSAVDLETVPTAFADAIGISDDVDVYASTRDMGWSVETTYYSVSEEGSSLLGYSTEESVNGETFTSFYDTEYMWVGNLNANDDGSQSNFNVEVNGERFEINEQRDADGNVVSSRSFKYDVETGEMLGGTEISGSTIVEYGANHIKLSESLNLEVDEAGLAEMLVDADSLSEVPPILQNASGDTYAEVVEGVNGANSTYFKVDASGNFEILGYAETRVMEGYQKQNKWRVKAVKASLVKVKAVKASLAKVKAVKASLAKVKAVKVTMK